MAGRLIPLAGRLTRFTACDGGVEIAYTPRHGLDTRRLKVARIINCTGPRSDYATTGIPLFADLRRNGLILPDPLGLGLETNDARVLNASGRITPGLFAIGSLTRPAWWEVMAVPEIAAQVTRLVQILTQPPTEPETVFASLAQDFLDLGAGI